MEPQFKTSFIPKKTLSATVAQGSTRKGGLNLIVLIALIIALGAVVLSVGAFLYKQLLISSIDRKEATLDRARAAFEPALIQELVRLDDRLTAAEDVLEEHVTPSSLFSLLGSLTLQSVQFTDFSFSQVGDGKLSIAMKGIARDFRAIALQADLFGKNRAIQDPIFSNLNLDSNGRAVFNFSAFVDPAFVSYVNRVDSGAAEPVRQVETNPTATSSSVETR
ncbi:hypothetical protein A3D62_00740 [Candidatus Kaiserbacteria bacterium RIFCSPHIGHO2_02_FULL_49_11]|uniref:PilN domain-containing protein n=1 Tax=Candidatus Kaiserbacteria bacterium RIFCSPHIGHO2_02_FULL_49_11 TaxID=1798489 RepID=A0A1F6D212_9BACT|nr:MAG: hypothetical protein A3D62_00740 [Candidatus Kaiserbacteria bacterium RIFCSPHIGHO2_02_FULL_49_11]